MEFILLVLTILCSFVRTSLSECPKPYSKCNLGKPGHLNVHIVSHTHLDLGWVKTVEEYYNGTRAFSYEPSVKNIIDSVVSELKYNPERKFVFVEIGFFWMWWNNQNRETKTLVHSLVEQGRLEFLLGAWSMNDEGTPYYTDIIDQQSLGLKFIKEIFGDCARPRSAWQIDPFGHSREQASLFSQFGFDGLFLGRVDYQDFEDRGRRHAREMLWQASRNLKSSQIFTSILPNVYWAPKGFCWEMNCYDESIMDDVGTQMTNVDRRVAQFMRVVKEQSNEYKSNHLIMTFGNDFTYSNSRRWFDNIDKLIKHVNARQDELKVNVFYSTPECYQYAINREETDLEVKYDDFFPYADQISRFWTGYFTSRPALKYNVRQTSSFLQSARHLIALGDIDEAINAESIGVLERAMGILQHHDAISGTEKQYVANDYSVKLAKGVEKTFNAVNEAVKSILNRNFNKNLVQPLIHCPLLNITECLPIENEDRFTVLVYNPLPRTTQTWITLPIVGLNNEVVDVESEKGIVSDTAPVYRDIELVSERKAQANYRLLFKADLPPMGFKVFRVQKNKQLNEIGLRPVSNDALKSSSFSLKNEKLGLRFDPQGNLIGVENFESGISTAIKQALCYYVSEHTYSGAYVFRPKGKSNCLGVREYSIGNSKRLTEVHQVYNDWLSQTIRLYEGAQHVDIEWQVGPIDINDEMGKDVVMTFASDLTSNGTFYTDSNGREILARRRDYRPTWRLFQTDSISGNYYPVNSRIFLRDETNESDSKRRQMTLLSDRSQGGSSLTDGSLEVMLHRRQLHDDGLGVNEALNETGTNQKGLVVRGVTSLIFDTVEKSARIHRQLAHEINNKPLVTFSINDEANIRPLSGFSALSHELPRNLHVLTFASEYSMSGKPLTANSILVRIEHYYEKDEDSELSQPVTVNLKEAFGKTFNFVGVEELALGANIKVNELDERLKWRADVNENYLNNPFEYNVRRQNSSESSDPFTFTFYPMQIRTFRLMFLPKYM